MRFARPLILAFSTLLCGCASYHFGPTNGQVAGARSVQITPFLNHSPEPGLADEVTAALRKAVQRDGTLRLNTRGDADIVVSGTLMEYRRRELSLLREDLRTVRDYQVTLSADVKIRERTSGQFKKRVIKGETLLRVNDDFGASERQAAPLLADDLARQIKDLLVDGEW